MKPIAWTGISTPLTQGAPWISEFCKPSLDRRSQWDWGTPRFDMNSAYSYWKRSIVEKCTEKWTFINKFSLFQAKNVAKALTLPYKIKLWPGQQKCPLNIPIFLKKNVQNFNPPFSQGRGFKLCTSRCKNFLTDHLIFCVTHALWAIDLPFKNFIEICQKMLCYCQKPSRL